MFFFMQKTAYVMRISDWISDVFSSDLQSAGRSWPLSRAAPLEQRYAKPSFQPLYPARDCRLRYVKCSRRTPKASMFRDDNCISQIPKVEGDIRHKFLTPRQRTANKHRWARTNWRSEEHTSELQSLMRISYAVFGWNKNNYTTQ